MKDYYIKFTLNKTMLSFYVSRYVTDLYTFELVFSVCILIICLFNYFIRKDKYPLYVFSATTLFHSILELIAQGSGTRTVEPTHLFGIIEVGYPFIPIIIGLFEGGMVGLCGLLLMRAVIYKDKFSLKFFLIIIGLLLLFEILGVIIVKGILTTDPGSLEITRRHLFSEGSIILLIIMYSIAIIGILPWKNIPRKNKFGLLYYYIGIVAISLVMIIPLHVAGTRFIEYFDGVNYIKVNIMLQILIMYGYDALVEAAGFFMAYYVLFYYLKWLKPAKIDKQNQKQP
ncbi:MAG: hypothetical protein ACTSRP_05385 [Candidatus Helarchaeota archaeon]